MPSTYTSGLRLTNQADGENANTWGQIADANYEFIDDAITRVQEINVTGASSYTLTVNNGADDEARSAVLEITGIPTSANSIIVPSSEKVYAVNAQHTSVSGGITIRTGAGTGVNYIAGQKGWVYCDGVSVFDLTPLVSALDPSENLGDLPNVSAALVNLGLGGFGTVSSFDSNDFEVSNGVLGINVSALFEVMWPVGSLYSNRTDNTNPGTLMGFGTWTSAGVGRVPIGVGTGVDINGVSAVISAESCGGEYEHVQTTAELVPHFHTPEEGGKFETRGAGDSFYQVESTPPTDNEWQDDKTNTVGGGEAFNVQQPWYSVYQWIRTA